MKITLQDKSVIQLPDLYVSSVICVAKKLALKDHYSVVNALDTSAVLHGLFHERIVLDDGNIIEEDLNVVSPPNTFRKR
jgi:hypothetical protein